MPGVSVTLAGALCLVCLGACSPGALVGEDTGSETSESGDGDGDGDEPQTGDGDGDGDGPSDSRVPDGEADGSCHIQPTEEPLCVGPGCPILRDFELWCDGVATLLGFPDSLGLSPDELVWGFRFGGPDYTHQALVIHEDPVFIEALPEGRFSGQTPDGALLRSVRTEEGEAPYYMRRVLGGWELVEVPDLPLELGPSRHLRFSPVVTAANEVEGYVSFGDSYSASYYWARRNDNEWQLDAMGESSPSHGPHRIDLDAGDRPYALHDSEGYEGQFPELEQSPIYAMFPGDALTLVGELEHGPPRAIAQPPRPQLGGPAIAALREHDDGLFLLTIDELDSWTEVELDTPPVLGWCPYTKEALDGPEDPCPPCQQAPLGVAGWGLARTSGGALWLATVESEGGSGASYELMGNQCKATSFEVERTGVLRVREVDASGATLRELDVPLGGLVSNRSDPGRVEGITGFGDQLAIVVSPVSHHHSFDGAQEGVLRVMTVDTALLE